MTNTKPRTPDEIWTDDKLGRRAEAEKLLQYIKLISADRLAERGHTIAIDVGYGHGKTFFLKRLRDYFALSGPVAFVDSWADDIYGEPLVALMAALDDAIREAVGSKVLKRSPETLLAKLLPLAARISNVTLRAALIGAGAGAVTTLYESIASDLPDPANSLIKNSGEPTVSSARSQHSDENQFRNRVARFQARKQAATAFKMHLRDVCAKIRNSTNQPLIIIIDELDRCRPDYAIRTLEEIKHLFDVPDVIFILALEGEQLARSVAGVYGERFDGKAYLHRFFDKKFTLLHARPDDLVGKLIERYAVDHQKFFYPQRKERNHENQSIRFAQLISDHVASYRLSPREIERVVEQIGAFSAGIDNKIIYAPYAIPLVIELLEVLPPDSKWRRFDNRDSLVTYMLYDRENRLVQTTLFQLARACQDRIVHGLNTDSAPSLALEEFHARPNYFDLSKYEPRILSLSGDTT